jgi:hypothetical protein
MTSITEIQNEKLDDFQKTYNLLTETLNLLKNKDKEYISDIATKVGLLNEEIYKIKSEMEDITIAIKKNNFELSTNDKKIIEQDEYQKKIINKFLPSMLAYSLIIDN